MAPPVLYNWDINVTWTPVPGTYAAQSRIMVYRATTSTMAMAMCTLQCGNLEAIAPVTYGTPTLRADQSW
jgi:hypothetical protein